IMVIDGDKAVICPKNGDDIHLLPVQNIEELTELVNTHKPAFIYFIMREGARSDLESVKANVPCVNVYADYMDIYGNKETRKMLAAKLLGYEPGEYVDAVLVAFNHGQPVELPF
ncbi:MAG: hypothetical protein D6706_17455, partial [Chloroflexi bacterium]